MAVIRDMLGKMEAEHKTKLEQLHSMQEQHRCPSSFYKCYYYYYPCNFDLNLCILPISVAAQMLQKWPDLLVELV